MSEHSETRSRPLAPTIKQEQQQATATSSSSSPSRTKHCKSSQSSDDCSEASKPGNPRRRPGKTAKTPSGPHAGSSRPGKMLSQGQATHYTRTGRISKAKKGLKVHNCECGRSYTRAEHLRRHQKNHAQDDVLRCDYVNCGRSFFRPDLLLRHRERHNDPGSSPHQADRSPGGSPEAPQPSTPIIMSSTTTMDISTSPTASTAYAPSVPGPATVLSPKQTFFPPSRTAVPVLMALDGMGQSFGWGEQYGHSPAYSSSSEYASPNIGPGEYSGFLSSMPYGHSGNRTRTPSNASIHDHWAYTPRSPSSSISTMPYAWASNEKMPTAGGLAYMNISYPMGSLGISTTTMDATADYGQFGLRTMKQRDADEAGVLFQDEPYGMAQLAHTYPSEQYLNNYWRLFHPTFPIIHRPTFGRIDSSPMLRAAMMAVEGQYSNDTNTKNSARRLHDRCIKLLDKRNREPIADSDRLCDHQAVFLVEVLSQYRARRAAKALSPRFGTLYQRATQECENISSQLASIVPSLDDYNNVTMDSWKQWAKIAVWQRLLTSCYVLESQQATLLAREPLSSMYQHPGSELPFPTHSSVWDAATLSDWAIASQQHSPSPQYVYEVTQASVLVPCDPFQSSILIAAYYNRFDVTSPYMNGPTTEEIDHIIDDSFATKQNLLTAKLLQVTPVRSLLAVSGESWILSEKVSSPQAYTEHKINLRAWVTQIWSARSTVSQPVASEEALKLAVQILQTALTVQPDGFELNMGLDMGIYVAALVLWAVTASATTRKEASGKILQPFDYRHIPQPQGLAIRHDSIAVPMTSYQLPSSIPTDDILTTDRIESGIESLALGQPPSPDGHDSISVTTLVSYDQIALNTFSFLSIIHELAALSQQSPDLDALQAGCISMLLWVKLQLRGATHGDQNDMAMWTSASGDGLGELLNSVVGSLEKVLNSGWTRWGI